MKSQNSAEGSPSFLWAFELLRSLYDEGVRELFISPGSRSTPLVLAAEAHSGFNTHVILDERSAGFTALGAGKCSPYPAALICTSGTAALNYGPAIQEASNSGTPLVVLTADRPARLRQTGSSQTIDQLKLFGDRVLFFHECGRPSSDSLSIRRLRLAGKQAVREAVEQRGVTHLNLSFEKPFEPTPDEWDTAHNRAKTGVLEAAGDALHDSGSLPPFLTNLLQSAKNPMVIAGPMYPSDPLYEIGNLFSTLLDSNAESDTGQSIPLFSDPGSPFASSVSGPVSHLLAHWTKKNDSNIENIALNELLGFRPDLIVRLGDTPYSPSLSTLLEQWADIPHLLITSRFTWQDPLSEDPVRWVTNSVTSVMKCMNKLAEECNPDWRSNWKIANEMALEALESVTIQSKIQSDYGAIESFLNRLPEGLPLFLSNSMIPRDVAILQTRVKNRPILVNRGAAGIDGITSTSVGAAISLKKPLALLTGDLAFLHDVGALALQSQLEVPLVIGVIQNKGGTIFRKLPVFSTLDAERFNHYFETPQNVNLEYLCKAYQIPFQRVIREKELLSFEFPDTPGFHVIEMVTDPEGSHSQRSQFIEEASALFLAQLQGKKNLNGLVNHESGEYR